MNGRTMAGVVLLVVGVALAALGVVGMAAGSPAAPTVAVAPTAAASPAAGETQVPSPTPSPTPSQVPTPTPSPTSTPSPSPTPSPEPTPSPAPSPAVGAAEDAAVRAFIAELVAAVRAGDVETMGDRLNEATIDRYGAAACEAKLATDQADPTYAIDVIEIHPPAPWDYTTDDRTTRVEAAWTIDATVKAQGQDARREVHLAPAAGGVTWFSDCGDPRP